MTSHVHSRARAYPLLGGLLVVAVVLGLPVLRAFSAGRWPTAGGMLHDAASLWTTYAYFAVVLLALVAVLGRRLGRGFDRTQALSRIDPLTGAFNRRFLTERMGAELARTRRTGIAACILCIDLDRLKAINDGLGHGAGDAALVSVAQTLTDSLRPGDVVARIGGDEFAVLLPETSLAEASALSRRIVANVSRLGSAAKGRIGVSIGISRLSAADAPADCLAAADIALYRAKSAGGGQSLTALAGGLDLRRSGLTLEQAAALLGERIVAGVLQ